MEHKFETQSAVDAFLSEISSKGSLTAEDMKELKVHMNDSMQQLEVSGLTSEEAFVVAKLRLGNKEEISEEFKKVNGVNMLHKEWVFIFIGISLTVLFASLIQTANLFIGKFTSNGTINLHFAAYSLSIFYLMIGFLIILLFQKGKEIISFFNKYLFRQNILVVAVFAVIIGLLTFIPLYKFAGIQPTKDYYSILIQIKSVNRLIELIVTGTIPCTLIIVLLLSFRSVNNPVNAGTVFISSNYLYIFLLGLGVETTSALLSRMLFPGAWFSPVIFGCVLFFLTYLFVQYNRKQPKLFLKVSVLMLFPFFIEVGSSILRITTNWECSPLFYFAIATIISTVISLLIAFFKTQKKQKSSL